MRPPEQHFGAQKDARGGLEAIAICDETDQLDVQGDGYAELVEVLLLGGKFDEAAAALERQAQGGCKVRENPSFDPKGIAMHAVFVNVTIDSESADESAAQLRSEVVPRVKQAPGFVAGYWAGGKEGSGRSCVIFDSEDAAQKAVEMIKSEPRPAGVTLDSVEAREVIASA